MIWLNLFPWQNLCPISSIFLKFIVTQNGRNVPDTGRFIIQLKRYWFYSSSQQWWTVLRIKKNWKKNRRIIAGSLSNNLPARQSFYWCKVTFEISVAIECNTGKSIHTVKVKSQGVTGQVVWLTMNNWTLSKVVNKQVDI